MTPTRPLDRTSRMAWSLVAVGSVDLAMRQVARRSLWSLVGMDFSPSPTAVLAMVTVAGAVLFALRVCERPRQASRLVSVGLALAFAWGLTAQLNLGARLQSDGFYYFAYLRSLWFDHDVDFTNDYRELGQGDKAHLFNPTPTGYAQSAWTIGPAIVWSPFFGVGDIVARRLAATGLDVKIDGTSFPYRQAVCVAGLFYGLLGLWFSFRLASRFTSEGLASAAMATIGGGSFMLWYLIKEPSMTHAPSMAAVAAFTYAWASTTDRRTRTQWLALGLGAGLMTTIRWQNALFALLPLTESLWTLLDAQRARDMRRARAICAHGLLFTGMAVVGFLPQMLAWHAIYGKLLAVSPVGPQIRWFDPQIVDILWSSRNGLFSTSPVLYCAAIGLVILAPRHPRFGTAALITSAAMIYFNATVQDWWGSASFGMRRFDGLIPLFTVGLAAFIAFSARIVARRPSVVVAALLGGLVLWNATFMHAALSGRVNIGEALSFGELGGVQVGTLHRWLGYPFSYPINLLYAIRNGVSPGRYDLLGPNRFLGDPTRQYGRLDLGRADEFMIGDGWHGQEREQDVTFRWAEPKAEVFVPLDHPVALRVQIRVKPFTFPTAQIQLMTVAVNGARFGPFALEGAWQTVEVDVERSRWRTGLNRVLLEFSRGNRPLDVGLGGDERLLSAMLDYIRVQSLETPSTVQQ